MFSKGNNLLILKKALAVIDEEEAAALPIKSEVEHITFSSEFKVKMERLIKRQQRPYYYLVNTLAKRVACLIVAILLAMTTLTFSVKAIRETVIKFFVETFEKFSIVSFSKEEIPKNIEFIETYYAPTYIPEGYELMLNEKLRTFYRLKFTLDGNYIHFTQNKHHSRAMYLDTEKADFEYISISGRTAYYSVKDTSTVIYWNDEHYGYMITTESKLSKEELIRIAESVKPE